MLIILTILTYFGLLLIFSKLTSRRSDNATFFRANKRSPWYMVAFGMVGASISGVTFVSVPGMVNAIGMTYMQTCLGFIVGYFAVAFLLLPVYYKLNLTTIYTYLDKRIGLSAYRTGAGFFILSKISGAAVRFYVVCMLLQRFVLDALGIPFALTVLTMVALIWLYTRKGGINTLVWTDSFQTFCMFTALILIIWQVIGALGMSPTEAIQTRHVANRGHTGRCCRRKEQDVCARRLGFKTKLLETVYQWCLHRGGNDGTRPRHDAEKPNLQNPSRGPKRHVHIRFRLRTGQFAVPCPWRIALHVGRSARCAATRNGRRAVTPIRSQRFVGHTGRCVIHHRHCGRIFQQCRLRPHRPNHLFLCRHLRPTQRRTLAQAHPPRHGGRVCTLHPPFPRRKLHLDARCHIHSLLVHLRPAARTVCLCAFHPAQRWRQMGVARLFSRSPTLFRRRNPHTAVLHLPLWLRTFDAQRRTNFHWSMAHRQQQSAKHTKKQQNFNTPLNL